MRREGKTRGIRTNQTVRYIPHCGMHNHTKTFWSSCGYHSRELLDFVYREHLRLERNPNLSRLQQIESAQLAQSKSHSKVFRAKSFRCIRGSNIHPRYERVEALIAAHKRRIDIREDAQEQMQVAMKYG